MMSKSFLSFALLICVVGVAYLFIGDRLDEQVTSDALVNAQQVSIVKAPASENPLTSGTFSTGGERVNDVLIEQERISLKDFIEEVKTENIPLLVTSGVHSMLYLGNQSSGVVQVNASEGVDMYTYFLEELDYSDEVIDLPYDKNL